MKYQEYEINNETYVGYANEKGKQGTWKVYSSNGDDFEKLTYKDNKLHGERILYGINNKITIRQVFDNGKLISDGYFDLYYLTVYIYDREQQSISTVIIDVSSNPFCAIIGHDDLDFSIDDVERDQIPTREQWYMRELDKGHLKTTWDIKINGSKDSIYSILDDPLNLSDTDKVQCALMGDFLFTASNTKKDLLKDAFQFIMNVPLEKLRTAALTQDFLDLIKNELPKIGL